MNKNLVCLLVGLVVSMQVFAAETPAERKRAQRAELVELEARHVQRSAIGERKLLLDGGEPADRLKVAEAYVVEAESSPSKLDSAWSHVSAVLEQNPANVQALLLAGRIGMLRGQPAQAQVHYQAATVADPTNAAAFLGLGESLSRIGSEEQASRAYSEFRRLRGLAPVRAAGTGPPVAVTPGQEPPRILNRPLEPAPPARKNRK